MNYLEFRPIQDEIHDSKIYKNKRDQTELKKKILTSYYNPAEEESVSENEENEIDNEQVKKELNKNANGNSNKELNESIDELSKKNKSKTETVKTDKISNKKQKKDTIEFKKVENKMLNDDNISVDIEKKNGIKKKKKKNKNIVESLTDERLAAYGINPKKFKKKLKYSNKNK